MKIRFSKMHGLGNDFMVIDAVTRRVTISPELVQALSHRHQGVGFDQLLLIEPSSDPNIDFFYRVFNADGSEVGQCGNGVRCLMRFVQDKKLTNKNTLTIKTQTTQMRVMQEKNNLITVEMGEPNFTPDKVPFNQIEQQEQYQLLFEGKPISFHALSMGNPHAVIKVDDVNTVDINSIGQWLEHHPLFPEGVNVGFMQILDKQNIALRVFERGVGETLACGSGACAAAAVAIKFYHLEKTLNVKLLGGELVLSWPHENEPLRMTGPAILVFDGEIEI